jgi:hypothetical protein
MADATRQIVDQSNRIATQFLIADLAVALTFLDVAEVSDSEEARRRNRQNAYAAYDTVLRLLPRISPSEEERPALESRLAALRDRLLALGFPVEPGEPSKVERRS